jgi:hypothetical protein
MRGQRVKLRDDLHLVLHARLTCILPASAARWEGVELAAYWQTVGKALVTERLYSKKQKT